MASTATLCFEAELLGHLGLSTPQVFNWTGRNSFFVKGDLDSLMVGSGRCVSQGHGLPQTRWKAAPCQAVPPICLSLPPPTRGYSA